MRKKRDARLASEVGKRIRKLIGKCTYTSVARELGVRPHTVWSYANGVTLPSIEVLLRISELGGVSTDLLLKGAHATHAASEREKLWLRVIRNADSQGMAGEVEKYLAFLIERERRLK